MLERPLIYGHRGMGPGPTENTIASFSQAFDLGVDGIELDIHRTLDNQLLVHHHSEYEIIGGGLGYIFDSIAAQVKEHQPHIRRLDQVFEQLRNRGRFMIEIKREDRETASLLLSIINSFHLQNQVEITSYKNTVIEYIHRINPNLRTAIIFEKFPAYMDARQIEMAILDAVRFSGARVVHLVDSDITPRLVDFLHANHNEVNGHGDSIENIKKLKDLEVDQFTTNIPAIAVELCKQK